MEPQILLAQLRALIERTPDLDNYSPMSKDHMVWLAQAHALIQRWDRLEAVSVKISSDSLYQIASRMRNIASIFGSLHRAVADLELKVPADVEVGFGAGNVYDFFTALNKVILSAEKSIFIIDPYLDHSVFDHYLNSRQQNVNVRLLLSHKAKDIMPAANKYVAQHGRILEVRESRSLHDRVIFIDNDVCWAIGQSLKDAAKAKPTYMVHLPPDVVPEKLNNYEMIWASANVP